MATKVFILANRNSIEYLKDLVEISWVSHKEKDKRIKDNHFYVHGFSNYESYEKANFNELIKINQNHLAADKIYFLITPELFWKSDDVDEGYEYALEIITNRLNKEHHTLQFRFLSVLPFNNLFKESRLHFKRFVEAFPYFDLIGQSKEILKGVLYSEYTQIHYSLIKKIIVSDDGYINYLQHEVDALISDKSPTKIKDMYFLNGVLGLKHLINNMELFATIQKYTLSQRNKILRKCKQALSELLKKDESERNLKHTRQSYKVLIIEDNEQYRFFLRDLITDYFDDVDFVEPIDSEHFIDVVDKKLHEEATNYDIIFLDLLFKNKNGNWSLENGLDLLKKIKEKNPFCVTPIVTGLPRAVIASLVKEMNELGIPYHLLLSKKEGEKFLRLDFAEKFPDIVKTCKENKRDEALVKKLMIPDKKPFTEKVRIELYKRLNGSLDNFQVGIKYSVDFEEMIVKAFKFYKQQVKNKNLLENGEWHSQLPTTQVMHNLSIDDLWNILDTILTYRLILLYYAINSKDYTVRIDDNILEGCADRVLTKNFVSQYLGFHCNEVKKNSNGKDSFIIGYKIILQQKLFPHEFKFILELEKQKNIFSGSLNKSVKDWFVNFLQEDDVYENLCILFDNKIYTNMYQEEKDENILLQEDFVKSINLEIISELFEKLTNALLKNAYKIDPNDKICLSKIAEILEKSDYNPEENDFIKKLSPDILLKIQLLIDYSIENPVLN